MHINIKNVDMEYQKGKKVLNNINLEMHSPNFIGLLGPNGAGKSTFYEIINFKNNSNIRRNKN